MTTLGHSTVQRCKDCFEDCAPIAGHFMIPEAEEGIAECVKTMGPQFVGRTLSVLKAIDFDYEMPVATEKIDDVRS